MTRHDFSPQKPVQKSLCVLDQPKLPKGRNPWAIIPFFFFFFGFLIIRAKIVILHHHDRYKFCMCTFKSPDLSLAIVNRVIFS